MSFFRALIGGLVGGALGAGAWVAIGQFTGYEIGYVAVLVGFLAGWFVQKACAGYDIGLPHGIIASVCAILAIVGAKYSLVSHAITQAKTAIESVEPESEELIACVADSLLSEIREKGQSIPDYQGTSPAEETIERDASNREYPDAVVSVATEMWDQLLDEERQPFLSKARSMRAAAMGFSPAILSNNVQAITNEEFNNSFGLYDILWFALAVGAAVKFGSADPYDDEDDEFYDDEEDEDAEE